MEMWAMILAFVTVILSVCYYVFKDSNYFEKIGLPYMKPWPIFGSMGPLYFRLKTPADMIVEAYNLIPEAKYVGIYDFKNPIVIIRDPELIKTIAIKNFDRFTDRRMIVDCEHDPLFGKSLFSLRGNQWKEIRTTLSPAFTLSKLKDMFKLMNECAMDFTDCIRETMPRDKRTIDMKEIFARYANDVIATCAFGVSINSMIDPYNDFYVFGENATNFDGIKTFKLILMGMFPRLSKLLRIRLIPKDISDFFENVVEEVIDARDKNNIVRPDMIQLMIEARKKRVEIGKELSTIDIVSQAFSFFFGGFDTVSTAISFTCHEIGVNPDIQSKLRKEIDEVVERTNGDLTYDAINNMEYLDAVISESLRRYPIDIVIDRMSVENFELPPCLPTGKPFLMKKGTNVFLPIYGLHHDPKYFEDPYKFDPDRFIERGKEIKNSGVYFPFGLGPRMCIGNRFALLEMKVLIFHLLARCDLVPSSKTQNPLRLKKQLGMSAENGFWMNFENRCDVNPALKDFLSGRFNDESTENEEQVYQASNSST